MSRNAMVGAIVALIAAGAADARQAMPSTPGRAVHYPPLPPPPVQLPVVTQRGSSAKSTARAALTPSRPEPSLPE